MFDHMSDHLIADTAVILMIMDIQAEGINFMPQARRIKADFATASPRLVLLTPAGLRREGEEARQLGIAAYLTKPVRQSELYDTLATVMSK